MFKVLAPIRGLRTSCVEPTGEFGACLWATTRVYAQPAGRTHNVCRNTPAFTTAMRRHATVLSTFKITILPLLNVSFPRRPQALL